MLLTKQVPWILLTTITKFGKFTVAPPFFAKALGQTVTIFLPNCCFLYVFDKRRKFLKIPCCATVLDKYGKFEDVSTFLT